VNDDDTIAAIATPSGVGGVGVVRVSGPRAIAIAASAIGVAETTLTREVRVAWLVDRDGARIDHVLAFAMRAPRSFTGEDVAELHGHGGTHNMERLLPEMIARGARLALPGEFTRRALQHGKLDLPRAEAMLDVIHAGSERAWRLAQRNLSGALGTVAEALERRTQTLLAELEGRVDFPDADLDAQQDVWVEHELRELEAATTRLADSFRHGRATTRGVTVALVGPVNVGKSALLNALVGRERALVASTPGTTRDYVEVQDDWEGVTVTLVDTAGTRTEPDPVEARGIELGAQRVEAADVVVVVNDGQSSWDDGARFGDRRVVVRSKHDLGGETRAALATSALTGAGVLELKRAVLAVAGIADKDGREDAFVTTARQHATVVAAREALQAALVSWGQRRELDLIAFELRHAVAAFAELRGVEVGDRVLDELFARFCIGK
jgi:tRNA modification GTPase